MTSPPHSKATKSLSPSHQAQTTTTGPLAGVTVIEMAGLGPVAFAGTMLADAGARLVRVQGRTTATVNGIVKPSQDPLSRGRIQVNLDLKKPGGTEVFLRLLGIADALIEGYRPGVMERLGIGPEPSLARKPSLVYGRMTGWGQSGPLARAAGHDINYIAISGALHAIGTHESPVPPLNLVGDFGGGGAMLAFGVASALVFALNTGRGQIVDAAMSDGAAYLMAPFYARIGDNAWRDERESNVLDGGAPHYGVYRCSDGKYLSVGPLEPQFWKRLLVLLGLDGAQEFLQRDDRSQWPKLRELLARHFVARTREEWCRLLEGHDACVAPVLSMQEAPLHPHNVARNTFIEVDGAKIPGPMPRFSLSGGKMPRPVSNSGMTDKTILAEAGFAQGEIEALEAAGVLCRV